MDSLTQMVLGAAVGEAVLGKKLGNRAMVWGGIAGTIPDLDVIANSFLSPIDALAFHRGITHSFVFVILTALLLGRIVPMQYGWKHHKTLAIASWSLLVAGIGLGIAALAGFNWQGIAAGLMVATLLAGIIRKRYNSDFYVADPAVSVREWTVFFWWTLVTHPLLDCFTTYGTQMLLPFSDYRISFNNIAVADPFYTLPFLTFLIAAAFKVSDSRLRSRLNWIGIGISSAYMLLTITNKQIVNYKMEQSLNQMGESYKRYMTTPTILNNILWAGIAETDTSFIYGQYSFFDRSNTFTLSEISKNHDVVGKSLDSDYTLKTLNWFSNGYFRMVKDSESQFRFFDLRFGGIRFKSDNEDQFVFSFTLLKNAEGQFIMQKPPTRPRNGDAGEMFSALINRIKGI